MPQVLSQHDATATALKPLCVDLDGTLVKSDTLVDSLLVMARSKPRLLLALPGRILRGKAAFKAFVTSHVDLDVVHLPYNRRLLQFLQKERAQGRELYLTTGSDLRIARRIADHLGIFNGVLGSDGATNLIGNKKLEILQGRFGDHGFAYIGNSTADMPLLSKAAESMVANPSPALRVRMHRHKIEPVRVFEERKHLLGAMFRAMRPHQWAKNLLVFLPPLLAHTPTPGLLAASFIAFFCFCCTASGTYLFNDLLDIEADRRSVKKRTRPFASGDLEPSAGLITAVTLLIVGLSSARFLPGAFAMWLLLYLGTTIVYSLYLKSVAIVDVLVLSGLYTLRLLAGGAATDTQISHWLAGFAIFLFLSLAIVKRFAEMEHVRQTGAPLKNGRGYRMSDIEQIRAFGTASAFAAVVVFANYISSVDVIALYQYPRRLWIIVPCMILWLCRVWLLAARGELNEDPVAFALTDVPSLALGGVSVAIVFTAL